MVLHFEWKSALKLDRSETCMFLKQLVVSNKNCYKACCCFKDTLQMFSVAIWGLSAREAPKMGQLAGGFAFVAPTPSFATNSLLFSSSISNRVYPLKKANLRPEK